jgi:hypothetical protein
VTQLAVEEGMASPETFLMKTRLKKTEKQSAVKSTASFAGNILLLPPSGSGKRAMMYQKKEVRVFEYS